MFESIVRIPDWIMVKYEGGEWKAPGAPAVQSADMKISLEEGADVLTVRLCAEKTPVEGIRLRWNFVQPLRGQIYGDAWERGYGDLHWEGIVPYRPMPWYFLAQREDTCAGYGVRVRAGALCFWQADPAGVSLWMDVRSGGAGVVLGGRTLRTAEVISRVYEHQRAFTAAQAFCRAMCDDPLPLPHPVYGSNNWYYAYGHSSHQDILKDTDYLMQLTRGLENRPYMVIDDGWQRARTGEYIGGPWEGGDAFPDMAGLAGQIRERGARPGIWVRLLLDRYAPEEWRLPHTDGLDPSRPEVLDYVRLVVRRLCGWGYELIKHDFSTFDIFGKWGFQMQPMMADGGWHFYDRSRTSAEIVGAFYEAILDSAAPTGTLILGCNTIGHLGAGRMHLHRTGDDTSGLIWERSLRLGVNTLAFRMPQHRAFFDVDADCLGITEFIPWEYNRQWGKLLAKSGTPLFLSPKPDVLSAAQEAELAEMLRAASEQREIAEPLDWQENCLPQEWRCGEERTTFHWYEETGLRVAQAQGPEWDRLYREALTRMENG